MSLKIDGEYYPPKPERKPSPLVIAADQLAQAAEKVINDPVILDGLRTALANYKRLREG